MNLKKLLYLLGWLLIAIGVLGLLGMGAWSIQIPRGAEKVNDYAYTLDLGNGQQRLVISSKPLEYFWLFDIMSPRADNRYTVMNIYPSQAFNNEIYAGDGTTKYKGFAEYNLYQYSIQSITSARLYFGGQLNKLNTTTKVNIYQCSNIPSGINWNNTPSLGALQGYINVSVVSPEWQSLEMDVTTATIEEFNNEGIATFAFICPAGEGENGGEACFGRESDPAPTLQIDYVPGSSGGGSSGGTGGDTGGSSSNNTTSNSTSQTYESDITSTGPGFNIWAIICVIIGIILVGYSTNGRFFR